MRIIFLTCFLLILTGCFGPLKRFQRATDKVEAAKTQIVDNQNQIIEKARGQVYAIGVSLDLDPNPNKYTEVGRLLSDRASLTLGQPSLSEAIDYQNIVKGLLSTNQAIKTAAERNLAQKDNKIIELQSEKGNLEEKLEKAEEKFKKVAEENAVWASKYLKIMRIIKWAVFSIIGIFVLRVVISCLPPPYNSIGGIFDFIIGGLFKSVSKVFTSAHSAAGVVGKEAFDVSEKTLRSVVDAVQKARQDEQLRAKLDPILKDATDKEIVRPKIIEVKTQLGHI